MRTQPASAGFNRRREFIRACREETPMRFGCCVAPDQIDILARAGYDFCELPAAAVQPFEDDAAALPALRSLGAAPLRPEAFNVLVPATLPLVGPQVDHAALQAYLRRAFGRMAQL